jgi:hypothetical protein
MDLDYQTIFRKFNKLGIDYLVVGGLAVNFHGVPRMTYNIDLMILLQSENILRLVSQLTRWGYKPKIPIDPRDLADEKKRNSWIRDKEMKALAGKCPANPALYAGSRGTTKNEISFPGSDDLWAGSFNFYSEKLPIGEIDLIFQSPIPYDKLKERSVKVELQEEKVPLISIHDLIELKVKAGRKQDLTDAEHLRRILEK